MEREKPVHPGVLLKKQLQSASIKAKFVAEKIQVSNSQFGDILNGKRRITPKIALLLEYEFGYRAKDWVRLQADYELEHERLKMVPGKQNPQISGREDQAGLEYERLKTAGGKAKNG